MLITRSARRVIGLQARPLVYGLQKFSTSAVSCEDSRNTHFGFRTVQEGDKESLVASSYDMMNDAMSLGIHRLWKNHFVQMLNPRGGIQCLDVAGGTGDIALRLLDHARTQHLDRETKVTVLDINPQMLLEGQKRLKNTIYWNTPQIKFQLGNAEALGKVMEVPERRNPPASTLKNPILPPLTSEPIASESMDLYTIAFGIRNCTHIDEVIREAYRVLKPGGIFACLEFGKVSVPLLAQLYKQYSFSVIPPLGQLLVGDRDSYQYLVESIERFPTQARFAEMVAEAGFLSPGSVEAQSMGLPRLSGPNGSYEDLSLGIATIWTAGYFLTTNVRLRRIMRQDTEESKRLNQLRDLPALSGTSRALPMQSLHIAPLRWAVCDRVVNCLRPAHYVSLANLPEESELRIATLLALCILLHKLSYIVMRLRV